ncbi:MAG: CHAT domain-containing protein, partial [Delftia sp.]|nr:CHAT domain-containing protein [Delftia sp.]
DLTVQESGHLPLLVESLARVDGGVDVLHISCHGTAWPEPLLLLEDELGFESRVTAEDLARALPAQRPRLIFLSACETAEPSALLDAMTTTLIRRGAPAVLGWGGPVGDHEATRFAAELYRHLALGQGLAAAVAKARQELVDPNQMGAEPSRNWHLARLAVGREGGGVVTEGGRARRVAGMAAQKIFLDARRERVAVAGPREFVGRRRQLQQVLRAFKAGSQERPAGVLIHGMGRQGKSSLAARVAQRKPDHTLAVLHGRYDGVAVIQAIAEALGTREIEEWAKQNLPVVEQDGAALSGVLRDLLEGPCA